MEKQFACPVCGKEFVADVVTDLDESGRVGIDTNTHNPIQFKRAVICPDCRYSSVEYTEREDQEVKDFVASEEYDQTKKIIDFELECISKKDTTEHYMDEV